MQRTSEGEPWDVAQMCDACRIERCHDESRVKIVMDRATHELRKLMRQSFEQIGVATAIGQAPTGYLEEELGTNVDMLSEA